MKQNIFDTIYLSWRPSKGTSRIMIGVLHLDNSHGVSFRYLKEGVALAGKSNFTGYPGLPLSQTEHDLTLDLFDKRLINTDREDSKLLLDFWGIPQGLKDDKLYILAMTQGKMHTDNFEFLARFKLTSDMRFVTDVAGLSYSNFNISELSEGTHLSFEKDITNKYDNRAIKIMHNNKLVGYVKKGHNDVFHESGSDNIKIVVKKIIHSKSPELFITIYNP